MHIKIILQPLSLVVLILSASASAQTLIEEIGPQPVEATQCIDNEPLGDGFGWNGICTCFTDDYQDHSKFGWSFASDNNTLVVGAEQSPLGCFESGSITIYEIMNDGSLNRQDELVSSLRTGGDRFGGRHWNGELMDVSGDYIAVGTFTTPMKVAVFRRSVNGWSEKYAFTLDESVTSGFSRKLIRIVGDDLFVGGGYLQRYDLASGEFQQQFDGPFNENCQAAPEFSSNGNYKINGAFVSMANTSCIEDKIVYGVYEKNDAGTYVQTLAHEAIENFSWIVLGDEFAKIVETTSNNGELYTGSSTTYKKEVSGEWRSYVHEGEWSPTSPSIDFMHGLDDQLVMYNNIVLPGNGTAPISFLGFTPETGWSGQQLNYARPFEQYDSTVASFSGNRFSVLNSEPLQVDYYRNVQKLQPDTIKPALTVFERDSAGQWSELYEESYTGGGSVPLPVVENSGVNTFVALSNGGFLNIVINDDLCDYSDADLYDGWGWNPATRESCPPLDADDNTDGCDYGNADSNGGWGWNAELGESCPPLESEDTTPGIDENCDYSSASLQDGWGWNPVTMTSCPPADNHAEDECIDTDGDGWGWDGNSSCLVDIQTPSGNSDSDYDGVPCIDTDGDGWGWQVAPGLAGRSCQI